MDIQHILNLAEQYSWLIVVLPIIAFVLIAILIISAGKAQRAAQAAAPWLLIVALGAALLLALTALVATNSHEPVGNHALATGHNGYYSHTINWMTPQPATSDKSMTLKIGILLDPLSALMLVVVLIVSLLVQIYSLGYMKRDEHPRFLSLHVAFHRFHARVGYQLDIAAVVYLLGISRLVFLSAHRLLVSQTRGGKGGDQSFCGYPFWRSRIAHRGNCALDAIR